MTYKIKFRPAASKNLKSLDKATYVRIREAIDSLAETPRRQGCTKLAGMEAWRIRVGHYRVVYTIADRELVVLVIKIGRRRDIYKSLS